MLPCALIFLASAQAQEPHSDCGCDIRRGTMCTSMKRNGADFAGADLARLPFSRSDLAGANQQGANFTNGLLMKADLSGANIDQAIFLRA